FNRQAESRLNIRRAQWVNLCLFFLETQYQTSSLGHLSIMDDFNRQAESRLNIRRAQQYQTSSMGHLSSMDDLISHKLDGQILKNTRLENQHQTSLEV
ncbi:10153_t:CDS:2, partial [Acaulospora morrowiae]